MADFNPRFKLFDMKLFLPLFCLFFVISFKITAQSVMSCGTSEIHERLLKEDSVYRKKMDVFEQKVQQFVNSQQQSNPFNKKGTVYTIPVVVHVVHSGEPVGAGTNLSDGDIIMGIAELNQRYRNLFGSGASVDMEVEFCLATVDPNGAPTRGINRVNGASVPGYLAGGIGNGNCGYANEATIKNLSRWSNTDYYNIWVVRDICNKTIAGYAYYPWANLASTDGTAVVYNYFRSPTLAHELGHGFGLYHTFEGDNDGLSCPVNTSCSSDGDKCCDTPPHKRGECNTGTGCTSNGVWDNSKLNYMSYCGSTGRDRFTTDQKSRVKFSLVDIPRYSLTTAGKCVGPIPSCIPANDKCDGAVILNDTTALVAVYGTIECATADSTIAPDGCNTNSGLKAGVFYKFIAKDTITTVYAIPADSSLFGMDLALAVYSGTSCNNLSLRACANPISSRSVTLPLTGLVKGNTYWIRAVNSLSLPVTGATALFSIYVKRPTPCFPANDKCEGAVLLKDTTPVSGTFECATADSSVAPDNCTTSSTLKAGVFYKFIPNKTNTTVYAFPFDSTLSGMDLTIAVYSGTSCNNLSLFACANPGFARSATLPLTGLVKGNTYWIRVVNNVSLPVTATAALFTIYVQRPVPNCISPEVTVDDATGTDSVVMKCVTTGGAGGKILYEWYNASQCGGSVIGTDSIYIARTSGNYSCKAIISGFEDDCFACDKSYADVKPSPDIILSGSGNYKRCDVGFYDAGGKNGTYPKGQNNVVTLLPAVSGTKISVNFQYLKTQTGYKDSTDATRIDDDILYIYNGNTAASPQIAALKGNLTGQTFTSSATDGSLTFKFVSHKPKVLGDNSVRAGWFATINCITPPPVGIKNTEDPLGLKVFPNPTKGVLNLSSTQVLSDHLTITLTNMLGQVVSEKEIHVDGSILETSMDISGIADGVYFMMIHSGETSWVVKVQKQGH
jgi:hypothetical protein